MWWSFILNNHLHSKHSIRKEYKAKRLGLKSSPALQLNIQKFFKDHVKLEGNIVVGAYYATEKELDLAPLMAWLHEQHIICALPKITSFEAREFDFLLFNPNTKTRKNRFGACEPIDSDIVIPDIIILPLIACDLKGNRLGYGFGYYDKYLSVARAKKSVVTVGICYEDQIYDGILPSESHDQKLDFVVTDKQIYDTKKSSPHS